MGLLYGFRGETMLKRGDIVVKNVILGAACGLLSATIATAAVAQTATATPVPAATATTPAAAAPLPGMAPAPPGPPPMTPQTDLLGASCGEFLATLAVANPGPNPTDDRKSQATRAQRDAFMYIIWANGYSTAKSRMDLKKASLTKEWITSATTKMAQACKTNPNMSVFEAAGKL
jgi:hypothetical protein